MGTAETPSYLPPSALRTRLRWDVFLSFRGEDTRESFTVDLHAALTANGVRAFIDNEGLERGDEISPALLEAIEDSAAAVAILSRNYADSRWCLEELSGIFDRRRLVLPVFYAVDPSDVRKQKGPFEAAFEQHERDERLKGKVEQWRKCMNRVGNLAGYVVVESMKSVAIQLIVKKVIEILSNTPEHVAEHAVGLDHRAEAVLRILHSARPHGGVRVLGIHGTPGIGKTTLAKAIFNKLVASFEYRSFVSNVNEILTKEGPWSVQRKIICDVTDQADASDGGDVGEIALEFRQIIHERRVVIVLDDVSAEEQQLSSLCAERDWIHEGSLIIITSRNRQVLQHFAPDVELYEATMLDTSESLELFSYHALRRKKPTDAFLDLSEKFVSLTGGLPLALQVFGSFLLDKRTVEEWEDALRKMEQIRPSGLQDVLKISFHALDDEEKCIFLDISCLLIQMRLRIEEVVDVFEGCGFKAKVAIGQLVKKSLLKINEDGTLWMHDQIRDMGRQIVIDESLDDLGMRSRLWDTNEIVTVLIDKTKLSKSTRGLVLDIENKNLKKDLSADIISQLQYQREPSLRTAMVCLKEKIRARFLSLHENDDEMILSTRSFEQMPLLKLLQINYLKLQGDFKYMPAELRWLKWQGCSLQSLPSNLPRQIRVLDLSTSNIECLLDRKWTPRGLNEVAQNLTVLNLRGCCRITTLPDLSSQRSLKKLILENCRKLTMIPNSIGGMSSLVQLNMKDCSSLLRFPDNVDGLKSLKELILSGCSQLKELPDDIRSLKSLQQLLLDNTAISKLPGYLYWLKKLELLSLSCCSQLKCIPICIGKLESLKELRLDHSAVEELPDSIGSLISLEKFSLRGCRSLTHIPESLGKLQFLEELFLDWSSVNKLPNSICSLLYLRVLSASQCRSLATLPPSAKGLNSLTNLELNDTPISQLPEDIGSLKVIKELNLRNCSKLETLPVSIGSLLSLCTLVLEGSAVKELPESITMLDKLSWLNLNRCKSLLKLPDSVGKLTSLSYLFMEETAVTKLPESFGGLKSLKVLKMKSSVKLVAAALPASFSSLSKIQEFDARSCNISGQVSDDFERLTSLQVLNLGDNSFESLPSSLVGLVFLKKLSLRNCKGLVSLPPLPLSLLELNAADCTALAEVSDLSNLESLHELVLSNCYLLSDVPGFERLMSLRRLYIGGCSVAASTVRQRISKVSLKKLNYLSIPCGEIPVWFSEEVTYSSREGLALTGLLIAVVVSVNRASLEASRPNLPAIVDVQAKIMRLNEPIHTKTLNLEGVPMTTEDQVYVCRFLDYHPLVSMLRDGDKLEVSVRSPGNRSIELKRRGIHMMYEKDDDYDGDEDGVNESLLSVSERLARFFRSQNCTLNGND